MAAECTSEIGPRGPGVSTGTACVRACREAQVQCDVGCELQRAIERPDETVFIASVPAGGSIQAASEPASTGYELSIPVGEALADQGLC